MRFRTFQLCTKNQKKNKTRFRRERERERENNASSARHVYALWTKQMQDKKQDKMQHVKSSQSEADDAVNDVVTGTTVNSWTSDQLLNSNRVRMRGTRVRECERQRDKGNRFYKKKGIEKNNYGRVEDLAPPCRQFGYGLIQFFQD